MGVAACSYPLLPSFSARVVLLGKVPQVVVVVKIEEFHQILKCREKKIGITVGVLACSYRDRQVQGSFLLKAKARLFFSGPQNLLGCFLPTVQNCIPLTEFPSLSSGGAQHIIPITLGTTNRIPPDTPDLAGRPTCSKDHTEIKTNTSDKGCERLFWKNSV